MTFADRFAGIIQGAQIGIIIFIDGSRDCHYIKITIADCIDI